MSLTGGKASQAINSEVWSGNELSIFKRQRAAGMEGTEQVRESDRRWLQKGRGQITQSLAGCDKEVASTPLTCPSLFLDPKGATVSILRTPEGDAHLGKNVLWGLKTQRIHLKIQRKEVSKLRTEPFSGPPDEQCLEHGCLAQLLAELLQAEVAICKQHFIEASL